MEVVPHTVETAIRDETRRLKVSTAWLIAGLVVLLLISVVEPMVFACVVAVAGVAGVRVVNRWLTRSAAMRARGWRRVAVEVESSGVWIGRRADGVVRSIADGQTREDRRVVVWRSNGMAVGSRIEARGWWSSDDKTLVLDDRRMLRTR